MTAIQNAPLLHRITTTGYEGFDEHARKDFGELAEVLRARFAGARCVLVFTGDDGLHRDMYPEPIAHSFFMEGHETLVLEPEDMTAKLLHAAYFSEPQYYLKTTLTADELPTVLNRCLKPAAERLGRNDTFDMQPLHKEFGDFVLVAAWWQEHRLATEAYILAEKAESAAERAAAPKHTVLGRIGDLFRQFFFF